MDNRPIGVFDSGLGGLTGVRELRKRLPHEEIIYFGDTGRVPYGSRSPETILQYARQDVAFLLSKDVKCIMAACGTVSSTYPAAEAARLPVPYLGVVDAAAREAAFSTRNRRIGVIGTAATIRSRSYEKLLRQLVPGVEITARACPLFVPLVEAGYVDHSEESRQQVTKLVIAQYLTEVRDAGVDTLILGCTHYPLLKPMIGRFMGEDVTLVDSGKVRLVFKDDYRARIAYHVPCHMEKLGWSIFTKELIGMIPGVTFTVLDSGCCGIAGTYGFKKENYKYSQEIGRPVFEAIKSLSPDFVCSECETCKWQIEMSTAHKVKNPILIIAEALDFEATAKANSR